MEGAQIGPAQLPVRRRCLGPNAICTLGQWSKSVTLATVKPWLRALVVASVSMAKLMAEQVERQVDHRSNNKSHYKEIPQTQPVDDIS
jgi:hypothetical protein